MKSRWALCAVGLLVLACSLARSGGVGLAGDYIDPVGKIPAQDESFYAHSSIRMATRGDWSTPMFMGRYALYKPPLLIWLSGASARILGISRVALRLPIALACSLAACLVFLWVTELVSWQAGMCAVVLLVSNHLWHVLAATCMTDGLLMALYTVAVYCLFHDPRLESRAAFWGFTLAVAAAILTKSLAGFPPLAMLGLYWLAGPRKSRPRLVRICAAAAVALGIAAPWFVWQMAIHGRWFWTEHVRLEMLGRGVRYVQLSGGGSGGTRHAALFYLERAVRMDPVLVAFALAAVPGFVRALRKHAAPAMILLCWLAIPAASLLAWQHQSVTYLLPLLPALAVAAGTYGPIANPRYSAILLKCAVVAFCVKVAWGGEPWGVSFRQAPVQKTPPLLSDYCARARGNELIFVDGDDDFYGSALPLAKLRYGMIAATASSGQYGMPFAPLGIIMPASQFNDLDRWEPYYRGRLREWGLYSSEPVGTMILAASPEELAGMIRAHPQSDFLVRASLREKIQAAADAGHITVAESGYLLLLARNALPRTAPPQWSCRL